MNMNKESIIEVTTKFAELRKEFNSEIRCRTKLIYPNLDDLDSKVSVMQKTMDKLLTLLDEMVRT